MCQCANVLEYSPNALDRETAVNQSITRAILDYIQFHFTCSNVKMKGSIFNC